MLLQNVAKLDFVQQKTMLLTLGWPIGAGQLLQNALVTRNNLWEETIQGAVNGFGVLTVVLGINVSV